jgi:hypothetical protein
MEGLGSAQPAAMRPRTGIDFEDDSSDDEELIARARPDAPVFEAQGGRRRQLSVGPHPALHGNSDTEQSAGLLWLKEAKQTSFDDGWRQRWFVHDAGALFWFNSSPTTVPRGSVELAGVVIDEQREQREKGRFLLVGPKRSYELRADDEEGKHSWTAALRKMSHLKMGFMHKRGGFNTGFRKRWFVLDPRQKRLFYYSTPPDCSPLGAVQLKDVLGPPQNAIDNAKHSIA